MNFGRLLALTLRFLIQCSAVGPSNPGLRCVSRAYFEDRLVLSGKAEIQNFTRKGARYEGTFELDRSTCRRSEPYAKYKLDLSRNICG